MDEKATSVAVIIPLYNGAKWIEETLTSVLSQELKPAEIIVVDDNSSDNGPELVRKYKGVILISNEGKGSSMARNLGTKVTKAPFVTFLDQDDLWHPQHLRLQRDALINNPQANSVISTAISFTDGAPEYDLEVNELTEFDPWTRFPFTIGVDGPSLTMVRREVLFDIGLWEERSTGMGDALLFLKLSTKKPLLKLKACTVGKRVHEGSQWIQIRDWGEKYLDFRHQVMRSALDFRIRTNTSDNLLPDLEDRLEALKSLKFLTKSIAEDDLQGILTFSNKLESQLKNSSEELLRHLFYCLMGALFPIHDSEKLKVERDRVFTELLAKWSDNAIRTRGAIEKLIGEKPLVS